MAVEISHRTVQTNGITMRIAEAGTGPLVILCHGFPESWYSWRHQLRGLAEAGYHAVAPDQRGYGGTDRPEPIDAYTQFHLVGDVIGLMDALGEEWAVIAGHDWGAPVAWNSALFRPDRIRGVIGLSVPFTVRAPTSAVPPGSPEAANILGGALPPTQAMKARFGDNFFYILHFQVPGVAEWELQRDVKRSLRMFLYSASGDAPPREYRTYSNTLGFLDGQVDTDVLPGWLTEKDLDYYAGEFARTGFRGALNWYRNMDRTWELMGAFAGRKVTQPALFIAGDRDGVISMNPPAVVQALREAVPDLRDAVIIPGCGHWTQQEAPGAVNEAMIRFLRSLD